MFAFCRLALAASFLGTPPLPSEARLLDQQGSLERQWIQDFSFRKDGAGFFVASIFILVTRSRPPQRPNAALTYRRLLVGLRMKAATVQQVWDKAITRSIAKAASMTEAQKAEQIARNVRSMRMSRGLVKKTRPKLES